MPRKRKLQPIAGKPNEFVDVGAPTVGEVVAAFEALSIREQWQVLKKLRAPRLFRSERPSIPMHPKPSPPLRDAERYLSAPRKKQPGKRKPWGNAALYHQMVDRGEL